MTPAEVTIWLWAVTVGLLPLLVILAVLAHLVLASLERTRASLAAQVKAGMIPVDPTKPKARR